MQTLIASLILAFATVYLAWRWMPKAGQQQLGNWASRKIPALSPYLAKSAGGCSSGCSSCGNSKADNTGCSAGATPKTVHQVHPIVLVRRQQ
ncbi:MAG: hypothetical protein V4488_18820 [Pseudomonadota bacterium]